MARPIRTFVYDKPLVTGVYDLEGAEAEHAAASFRLGPGDHVRLIDGTGRVGLAEIQQILIDRIKVRIFEIAEIGDHPPVPKVMLAVSVPKEKRMDWMIEKCTELGAGEIIPVEFRRSIVRERPGRHAKADKWSRTAREAAKQCGRPAFPEIRGALKFGEALIIEADEKYLLDPDAEEPLAPGGAESRILVMIGPEGGLENEERKRALAAGFKPARVGPFTLKIETAAAAATAILLSRAPHSPASSLVPPAQS